MRRIPPGQINRLYKRLYDAWDKYTNRWVTQKGYVGAEYFNERLTKLLQALQAELEGPARFGVPTDRSAIAEHLSQQARQRFIPEEFDESDSGEEEERSYRLPTSRFTQGVPVSYHKTHTPSVKTVGRRRSTLRPIIPVRPSKSSKRRSR